MTAPADSLDILFPVGRMVEGSLYAPKTTDAEGRPLLIKNGTDAGKPRVEYYVGVAIPKTPGVQHWANEPGWGEKVWAFTHAAWPNGQAQRPDFAFKITDGDSTIPNANGKRPCDREGFAGHWVVRFAGGTQPKIVNRDGTQAITEPNVVKPGHYVQVYGSVKSNASMQKPGLYMNHRIIAHSGYGPEIQFGPDAAAVGFGAAPLPPGASAVPLGGMATPPAPGATPPPPAAPSPAPAAVSPSPAGVPASPVPTPAPNAAFVANAAGAPPPPPVTHAAPPAAPPARTMTAAANGVAYEAFIAQGWTDEALIASGYMTA